MGIRGLSSWIRWAAPTTIENPDWGPLRGKKVGVDILGFLYRAKAKKIPILHYLSKFVVACRKCGIIPVPVFDGKPPDEKRVVLELRNNRRNNAEMKHTKLVFDSSQIPIPETRQLIISEELQRLEKQSNYLTSDERNIAKQFFYSCGIMSYNASGEADNVLAYLARRSMISAVISNDYDHLPRGVQLLLVPEMYALPGDSEGWKCYSLNTLLHAVDLTYNQFVEMCVLMGCDYTLSETVLPYKTAYWTIKYRGNMDKILDSYSIRDKEKYRNAYDLIVGNSDTLETLMGIKQWEKWAKETSEYEPETLILLWKTELTHLSTTDFNYLIGLEHS
jgi:flap endonuclease-1